MSLMNLFNELDGITEEKREGYMRCPFNYAGSKFRSLAKILPELPQRKKYIEPFGGTGAVLLNRRPSDIEVYNDRHGGVVALFRCIRDEKLLDALISRLGQFIHAREEFIWSRETWEKCDDIVERAARWYYANITSFSSLGRNYGRSIDSTFKPFEKLQGRLENIYLIHTRLKNVLIENQDWKMIVKDFDGPDTVFYLDPPYFNVYGGSYQHDITTVAEHKELLDIIFKMEGFCAVSSYANSMYESYPWTRTIEWEVPVGLKGGANTETNNRAGKVSTTVNHAIEVLYIK